MDKSISASEYTIMIVQSEFNCKIVDNLLQGAIDAYYHYNGNKSSLHVYKVPGAFEIPGTVKKILNSDTQYHGIVTLGCVIKGETAHFEHISSSVTDSLSKISISDDCHIPIIYAKTIKKEHRRAKKLKYIRYI